MSINIISGILGSIIISYSIYKYYKMNEIEINDNDEYMTKSFRTEKERNIHNNSITEKKVYIKTIVIKKNLNKLIEN
jgi:hypothetical protein